MESAQLVEELQRDMDRLRGRLFSLIEAAGLPLKQEEALKRCVRTVTYDSQRELIATITSPE